MSDEEKKAKLLTVFAEADNYAAKGDYQAELSTLSKGLQQPDNRLCLQNAEYQNLICAVRFLCLHTGYGII